MMTSLMVCAVSGYECSDWGCAKEMLLPNVHITMCIRNSELIGPERKLDRRFDGKWVATSGEIKKESRLLIKICVFSEFIIGV